MKGAFEELHVGEASARLYAVGAGDERPDLARGRIATTVEDAERLASGLDEDHADAVALAAIDRLAAPGSPVRIGVVGFSLGAAWAIWCAAKRPAVAASVVYYGSNAGPSLTAATVPVLGHFAEVDPFEPDEAVQAFEHVLRDAGRSVEIHRYPGTGHWFAEPSRDAWRPAAADLAFERTAAFLRAALSTDRPR